MKIGVASAIGRVHVRATATGMKIGFASAVGRLHVWGTAVGGVFETKFASAIGRMHFWGKSSGEEFVEPPEEAEFHPEMAVRSLGDSSDTHRLESPRRKPQQRRSRKW
jgi:hypothetical protein